MSWWKENDVGSLSPRRGPPVGYNTQAIPKVRPLVPDLSIFQRKSDANGDSLTNPRTFTRSNELHLEQNVTPRPPRLSDMSAGSKNDYFWRHGKSASTPSSVLESPQDLGKFLSHQSNQIQKLQDQMNSLLRRQQQVDVDLEMSSSGDASTSSHNSVSDVRVLSPDNGDSPVAGRAQTSKSPSSSPLKDPEELNRVLSEQSDQILLLQAQLDQLLNKCDLSSRSVLDKNSRILIQKSNIVASSTQTSPLPSPLPKTSASSYVYKPQLNNSAIASPGDVNPGPSLGLRESASWGDDVQDCGDLDLDCDAILEELKLAPPPHQPAVGKRQSGEVSIVTASVERLKKMGISFIDKDDIISNKQGYDTGSQINTLCHPRANVLSMDSVFTEGSLDLNSEALKRLDDKILTVMAQKSKGYQKPSYQQDDKNNDSLTKFGLPSNHMTMGTRRFLEVNHIISNSNAVTTKPLVRSQSPNHECSSGRENRQVIIDFDEILRQPQFSP